MTYSSFSTAFLLAAYQETQAGNNDLSAGDVLDRYELNGKVGWAASAIEEFAARGWLENDLTLGDERQLAVIFLGAGLREAEKLLASKLRVTRRPTGITDVDHSIIEATTAAADFSKINKPIANQRIDSSTWTGLPSEFEIEEERRVRLVSALDIAERDLETLGAGNEERAQARAYIIAIKALAEAPDPPADVIWELIGRANKLSGIASLFVSIIALFAVAH